MHCALEIRCKTSCKNCHIHSIYLQFPFPIYTHFFVAKKYLCTFWSQKEFAHPFFCREHGLQFFFAKTIYALRPESFCAFKVAIRKVQTFWASVGEIVLMKHNVPWYHSTRCLCWEIREFPVKTFFSRFGIWLPQQTSSPSSNIDKREETSREEKNNGIREKQSLLNMPLPRGWILNLMEGNHTFRHFFGPIP